MMGVYIKNMEMPKRGMVVNIYADGRVTNHFDEFGKTIGKAVPVPPHGRLIDAVLLKETLDYYIREAGWSDEINKALSWVKDEFIDSEQSIIPSSEEGE